MSSWSPQHWAPLPTNGRILLSPCCVNACWQNFSLLFGRCVRAVDSVSESPPRLVTIDAEPKHQIVPVFHLGKTNRASHQPLHSRPQIDVRALDLLRIFLTYFVLLDLNMPLIGVPPVRVEFRDAKRLQQNVQLKQEQWRRAAGTTAGSRRRAARWRGFGFPRHVFGQAAIAAGIIAEGRSTGSRLRKPAVQPQ